MCRYGLVKADLKLSVWYEQNQTATNREVREMTAIVPAGKSKSGAARGGRRTKLSDLSEQDCEMCFSMAGQGSSNAAILGPHLSDRAIRDLVARYEGRHPTRRSTPEIDAFFDEIYRQRALFRAMKEIEVAKIDPKAWLRFMARSRPGLEGWSELVPDEPIAASAQPAQLEQTPEEFRQTVEILARSLGIISDDDDGRDDPEPQEMEVNDEQEPG